MRVSSAFQSRIEERIGAPLAAPVLSVLKGLLPGTPAEFHELEKGLMQMARVELVAPLLEEILGEIHRDGPFVLWSMAAVRTRGADLRSTGDKDVTVRVAGSLEPVVRTPYMEPKTRRDESEPRRKPSQHGKAGVGLFPVLAALGFASRVSPFVASEVAHCSADLASYEEAATTIKRQQGLDLYPESVRTIANRVADAGLADRERGQPIDAEFFAGKRVVLGIDGGRLRCRVEKSEPPKESGYRGYETPWLEPKVFAAYTIDEKGEKVAGELPVYEGTLAPWKEAMVTAAKTLKRFGIEKAAQVAIAADGSDNIWREIHRLVEIAGLDWDRVTFFLDFYHATEHLADAAKLSRRFETDAERDRWVREQGRRLKGGEVEKMLAELDQLPPKRGCGSLLKKEIHYFRSRFELLCYDELKAQGFPIGTGGVESAIRRIINLRMKNPGTFWRAENAERMLYLRTRSKAGRWDEVEAAMHHAALLPEQHNRPAVIDRITVA